jgi:hypothetical protein
MVFDTMQEIKGDIWVQYKKGSWIVIPTNGFVKKNGEAVMGRGLAFQTKRRFFKLPEELGKRLKEYGNVVFTFHNYRIITFPVKDTWWEKAYLKLVEKSASALKEIFKYNFMDIPTPVFLPRVGCGNGKLDWNDVKPILEKYLDSRFIVCDWRS